MLAVGTKPVGEGVAQSSVGIWELQDTRRWSLVTEKFSEIKEAVHDVVSKTYVCACMHSVCVMHLFGLPRSVGGYTCTLPCVDPYTMTTATAVHPKGICA